MGLIFDKVIIRKLILCEYHNDEFGITDDDIFSVCHDNNIYSVEDVYKKCHVCDIAIYELIRNKMLHDDFIKIMNDHEFHKYHYDLILEKFLYTGCVLNDDIYKFIYDAVVTKKYLINMSSILRIHNSMTRYYSYELFGYLIN